MTDPLIPLFGTETLTLFRDAQLVVREGPIERLPEWMRTGMLSSIPTLCRDYQGPLQAAQGRTRPAKDDDPYDFIGEGGQTPISSTNPGALLRMGLSVHLGNLEKAIPSSKKFLRGVEAALGLEPCMRLSAFINAPGSGLPLHHDSHDQLLIHLVGRKTFSFRKQRDVNHPRISFSPNGPLPPHFGAVYQAGFSEEHRLDPSEIETMTLLPGTCLFLPAGTWHRTDGQTEPCLSLVTAVRAPSAVDLVGQALSALLMQSEDYRAPVYGLFSDPPHATESARLEQLLAGLAPRLSSLDVSALQRSFHAAKTVDQASFSLRNFGFTHFIRVPSTKIRIALSSDDADTLSVTVRPFLSTTPSKIQMDGEARPVIEWIAESRRAFSFAELTTSFDDFDPDDVFSLIEQLVTVGFLQPLPLPTSP